MNKDEDKKRKSSDQASPEAQFVDYNQYQVEAEERTDPETQETSEIPDAPKPDPSPFDNAGPIPAEMLKDPYPVEVVPLTIPSPLVDGKIGFFNQERIVWISAVVVSWLVTAVAVLRALRII